MHWDLLAGDIERGYELQGFKETCGSYRIAEGLSAVGKYCASEEVHRYVNSLSVQRDFILVLFAMQ